MDDYRVIADALAADINAGRLPPGTRLVPQRQFARQRGIANSTAARVYNELVRRGLAVGEIGRGTFVRAAEPMSEPALAEPGHARIDLELNFPVLPEQPRMLAESLGRMLGAEAMAGSLRPVGVAGTPDVRGATAALLTRVGWEPDPRQLLFAGNGRQAIAAVLAALVPAGERLGVEALTYPVVKGIASRLGITLVPLAVDQHGIIPDALAENLPLSAVYLQPALHNPLGHTMPEQRRTEIASTLREREIYGIEDAVYSFLRADLPPMAVHAPENMIVVDSLSKRLAPGLTLGIVAPPPRVRERIAAALRSGVWMATRFELDVATQWITDGTVEAITQAKRQDAVTRQLIIAERLDGFRVRADPNAYHSWWELPEQWRAETFVAAAAARGIAVTPAAAFTIGSGHAPNAVRLALASPSLDTLATALDVLAGIANGTPEDTDLG